MSTTETINRLNGMVRSDEGRDFDDELAAIYTDVFANDGAGNATGSDTRPADDTIDDSGTGDDTGSISADEAQTQPDPGATDEDAGSTAGAGAATDDATADNDAATVAPASGSLTVPLRDGTTITVDVDTAKQLLDIASWSASLDDEQRTQMAQIEARRAVAVDRAEYEQFQGWKQSRERDQANKGKFDDLLADLDDDQRAYLADLQRKSAEYDNLRNQPSAAELANAQSIARQAETQFMSGFNEWVNEHGLDTEDAAKLYDTAIRSQVIPGFVRNRTSFSPTGNPLDADYKQVARDALSFALTLHPDLHAKVNTPTRTDFTKSSDDIDTVVAAKKRRAVATASAPSNSVPQLPSDPRTMTHEQAVDAMTAFIRQSEGRGDG